MVTIKVNFRTEGKIFDDQTPGIRAIKGAVIMELLGKGTSRLDELLRPRPAGVYLSVGQAGRNKASTGHFRRSVNEVHGQRSSRIQSNVVYGPWLEGDSSRNQTTRFKGYGVFRKVGQELDRAATPLIQKHVSRFIKGLG